MGTFFTRYRNVLTLALVLLLQFVLLAVQVRPRLPGASLADQDGVRALRLGVHTVVAPPERVLHSSGLSLRSLWANYIDLVGVKEENEQLRLENQQLQLEQASLAEDARQGERLQELLAFKQAYIDQTVPAQVIGASGSDLERMLSIDKGAEDGIAPGMPVITPDGIVGRVRETAPHSSDVLLISDPTSATGVLLEQTRTRGVLRGDGAGRPEIVNLIPDDRIKPGQTVLTSGGDRIFPRGLPVGVVEKVVPDADNQPLVDVRLKPAANLQRLEEVLVVTGTAPAPSAKARRDLARSEGAAQEIKAMAARQAAAAAEAALEAQRASDILAQRLPSASNIENPDAPDAAPGASPATADSQAAPLHPPSALHPDHFSPGAAPKAADLTPGVRGAPLAEGTPETERAVEQGNTPALPSPSVSPAFRAAQEAAVKARARADGNSSAVSPVQTDAPHAKPAGAIPAHPAGQPTGTPRAAGSNTAGLSASKAPTAPNSGQARPGATTAHPANPPKPAGVPTRVVEDGPLSPPPAANPPKKKAPELVPDDGSRPPQAAAPQDRR